MLQKIEDERERNKTTSEHDGRRYHPSNIMVVDLSSKFIAIKGLWWLLYKILLMKEIVAMALTKIL